MIRKLLSQPIRAGYISLFLFFSLSNYLFSHTNQVNKEDKINIFLSDMEQDIMLSAYEKKNQKREASEKRRQAILAKKLARTQKRKESMGYKLRKEYNELRKTYPNLPTIGKIILGTGVITLIIWGIIAWKNRKYEVYADIKNTLEKNKQDINTIFTESDLQEFQSRFTLDITVELETFCNQFQEFDKYSIDLLPVLYKNLDSVYRITNNQLQIEKIKAIQEKIKDESEEGKDMDFLSKPQGIINNVFEGKMGELLIDYSIENDTKTEPLLKAIKIILIKMYPLYINFHTPFAMKKLSNLRIIPEVERSVSSNLSYNEARKVQYNLLSTFNKDNKLKNETIVKILQNTLKNSLTKGDMTFGPIIINKQNVLEEQLEKDQRKIHIIDYCFLNYTMNIMRNYLDPILNKVTFASKNGEETMIREKILQFGMIWLNNIMKTKTQGQMRKSG